MADEKEPVEETLVVEDKPVEPAPPPAAAPEPAKLAKTVKPRSAANKKAPEKKAAVGMPKSRWIILEESEDIPPTGLFVSHNGNPYLIKTGEPAFVPEHIIGILDDAIMTVAVVDGNGRRIGSRDRRRYNYREVAAPADAE